VTQSLTETLTEAAQVAPRADYLERDREAWNLPRASMETVPQEPYRDRLDWDGFRDLYYPDSRRHNLEAIVAYGAYKRSPLASPQPASKAARLSVRRSRPKHGLSTSGTTRAGGAAH
jgi:hypothetical protein